MSRTMRPSATRCSINFTNLAWSRVSKQAWMSASSTQHFLRADRRRERIQRVVLTAPRTEAVREPEKVRFVDGVEHLGDGALDNLIFQRGNAAVAARPPSRCTLAEPALLDTRPVAAAGRGRGDWPPVPRRSA